MWPFRRKAAPTDVAPRETGPKTRKGDGSVLGDLIARGVYDAAAGMEAVGHFNPNCAPFRTFPNNKAGLMAGPLADQLLQMMREPGVAALLPLMGQGESGDLAVELGKKLFLGSTRSVLETFQSVAAEEAIGKYLIVTTTMPFVLRHCTKKPIAMIDEVELELRLNAMAQLLLNDPDFRDVHSVPSFRATASGLLQARHDEVERMKQLTIAQIS